jgi:hypothetical protein
MRSLMWTSVLSWMWVGVLSWMLASERSSVAARILLGRRSAMMEILGMAPGRMHRSLMDVVGVMRNGGVILMPAA